MYLSLFINALVAVINIIEIRWRQKEQACFIAFFVQLKWNEEREKDEENELFSYHLVIKDTSQGTCMFMPGHDKVDQSSYID